MLKGFIKWFYSVVFKHGYWRFHPKDWEEIKKTKDKLTQKLVHFDQLPALYEKKGMKIHHVTCKICGAKWYTTNTVELCNKLGCWFRYYG
ncbi:MAG: hypothetical protein WC516_08760 [Patescibacteria group bacterium]|jgi:hypothetical protein